MQHTTSAWSRGTAIAAAFPAASTTGAARAAPAGIGVMTGAGLERRRPRDLSEAPRDVQGVTVTGVASEQDILIRALPGQYTLIPGDVRRRSRRPGGPAHGAAGDGRRPWPGASTRF